ncbi:hypothetical protein [Methylovulum psychrotolerans]|nr:hypothetical protein [Methylovulum psychrotolerans]
MGFYTMGVRADVVAYDSEGKLALVVEAMDKLGTNSEWAAKMRCNMLVNGYPSARFFLLALPDHFYLWKDKPSRNIEKPTYDIDPFALLRPYLEKADIRPEKLSRAGFELLVASWLNELSQFGERSEALKKNDHNKWLFESGLLDALKQGRIVSEAA